ncbi:MAG: hypothetical protein JNL08_07855 [Planctomycetes bacterium]|nr:hypothetical protein [Planctomycetota bacterium]
MPSAIRHHRELSAKGLVVILVEAQGADEPTLEHFLWKTFPDNECFSCVGTSVPLPASDGIPHAGLIGVDGTLLWAGNPLENPKQVETLIETELAKVKKGWGDTADARKVRAALYGKRDLGAAAKLVAALPEGDERTALQGEVDARWASAKQAIETLKQQGSWLKAQAAAKDLLKGVAGHAEWTTEATTIVAGFDTDEAKAELAADKKLEKVVKMLRDKNLEGAPKALQAVLKGGAETKVGARAQKLLKALETPLGKS